MTQLNVEHEKNGYIFGFADMPFDQRKLSPQAGDKGFWCAAPFGDAHTFFHKTRLIRKREEVSTGFTPILEWKENQATLDPRKKEISVTLYGEWAGNRKTATARLRPGQSVNVDSEMSSLSCVRVNHPDTLAQGDIIKIYVKNKLKEKVYDITNPSKNLNNHKFVWELGKESFINLRVSEDYVVYWLGHIALEEFTRRFLEYPCYFSPHPKNMSENAPGRPSDDFREEMERHDRRREKALNNGVKTPWPELSPRVNSKAIRLGILIAVTRMGKPLGAACYIYPPYALSESALYVLPQDLQVMNSL
jgi:hypothetical protein